MKRYLIIENSNSPHEEGIVSLVKVLKSKESYVVLFIGEGNLERVNELNLREMVDEVYCLKKYSEIYQVLNFRNRGDVVVYNTISVKNSIFTFLTSLGNGSNIYYIRNANSWLKYSWHYTTIIDFFTRNISIFLKKIMLAHSGMVLVENGRLKNYLISQSFFRVEVIPFKLLSEISCAHKSSQRIQFMIPGLIDFSRKKIDIVVEAFKLLDEEVREKVCLTLLGRTKGPIEEEKCREWKSILGNGFTYFSSFVPVWKFSEKMAECDVVVCAFKVQHKCPHFSETYGLTRGSGVDAHAISHSLPLIVNSDFGVDDEYESSTIKFHDSEGLCRIITELVNSPESFNKLKWAANYNAQNYSLNSIVSKTKLLWEKL
jgi:glycosyltransferase involved in cell wall biosynthesis